MGQTEKNQQRKDINHHLGRRIADRRLETGHSAVETGHSAAELDRVLSLNPGSIAAFESGRRSIGAGLLFTLGLALGVPMEFFIGDAPELPGALPDGLPPPETIAAPPGEAAFSNTMTLAPASRASMPAAMPAPPAPIIAMSVS